MNTIYSRIFKVMLSVSLLLLNVSCLENDYITIMLNSGKPISIPDDRSAGDTPNVGNSNTSIPNIKPSIEYDNQKVVVRLDMSGILIPNSSNDYLYLNGTGHNNQNIWLELDDRGKGFVVYNAIDGYLESKLENDLVFLIDNSGSMSDEADVIARDIVEWATNLGKEIDIRFAIVGYDGHITGAINFTDYANIGNYLNRSGVYGTSRTVGFVGNDASKLQAAAENYKGSTSIECCMAALMYAHENFNFRNGANRIYVNFTDECNTPISSNPRFSVEYLKNQENWGPENGTIHTVFSDRSEINTSERSVLMSEYTGGTVMETDKDFRGVSLDNLPITGAMQHSYVCKFSQVADKMDGNLHRVKITIYDQAENVRAKREFNVRLNAL